MNIAVVTCLDRSKKYLNKKKIYENNYEREAILCYSSWRKNAGWLKDLPIYAMCTCINKLKNMTIEKLLKLNVLLLEMPNIATNDYLYLNKLNAQYIFENEPYCSLYDYIIFIDLDIVLKKPIPKQVFNKKSTFIYYDTLDDKNEMLKLKENGKDLLYRLANVSLKLKSKAINTIFMIHYLKNNNITTIMNIYNAKFELLLFLKNNVTFNNTTYYLEEAIYDYAYLTKQLKDILLYKLSQFDLKFFIHKHLDLLSFLKFILYYTQ